MLKIWVKIFQIKVSERLSGFFSNRQKSATKIFSVLTSSGKIGNETINTSARNH